MKDDSEKFKPLGGTPVYRKDAKQSEQKPEWTPVRDKPGFEVNAKGQWRTTDRRPT